MTIQQHTFQTLVSETHSLHARSNGKIQLIIEVEAKDRKTALEAFSKPGSAIAVVRLPSDFDKPSPFTGYGSEVDNIGEDNEIIFH
jgi:hypothetical protein